MEKKELKIGLISEIEPTEVKWLWYPYIPLGHLTIIQGGNTDVKVFITNLINKTIDGKTFDGEISDVTEPSSVIYQTLDDFSLPMLLNVLPQGTSECAIEEYLQKIFKFGDGEPIFSTLPIFEKFEKIIAEQRPKLVILDDLWKYDDLDGNALHDINKTTKYMTPFKNVAEKYDCAIVFLACTKTPHEAKFYQIKDNLFGMQIFCRSNLLICKPNKVADSNRRIYNRLLKQEKNNLAPKGKNKTVSINLDANSYGFKLI